MRLTATSRRGPTTYRRCVLLPMFAVAAERPYETLVRGARAGDRGWGKVGARSVAAGVVGTGAQRTARRREGAEGGCSQWAPAISPLIDHDRQHTMLSIHSIQLTACTDNCRLHRSYCTRVSSSGIQIPGPVSWAAFSRKTRLTAWCDTCPRVLVIPFLVLASCSKSERYNELKTPKAISK